MARSTRGFSRILLVPVAALVALAFALAAVLGMLYGEQATQFLVEQLVAKSTLGLRTHLQRYLEKPQLVLGVNADAMRFGEIDAQSLFQRPEDWFLRLQRRFPEIDDVYFGRADGAIVGVDRTDGRLVLKQTTQFPRREFRLLDEQGLRGAVVGGGDYDATTREWYRLAVQQDRPVWSPIYLLQNKQALGMTAARPARDTAGQVVGVIGVNVMLTSIADYLQRHPLGGRSVSYIVERDGRLVAGSSTSASAWRTLDGRPQRVPAAESADPVIASSQRALAGEHAQGPAAPGVQQPRTLDVQGVTYWLYVTDYTDPMGLDWRLVSAVDPAPYLGNVRRMAMSTLALGAVLLVLLAWLVPRVTRRLATPLQSLAAAADHIAQGRYGQTVAPVDGGREVEQLVQAFNHMSLRLHEAHAQLHAHAGRLEEEVRVRTAELQQANDELARAKAEADDGSRAKSAFLATVSHEVRTPLNAISGLAYLLRSGNGGSAQPGHAMGESTVPHGGPPVSLELGLQRIEDAARHAAAVVNAVLDLSKIEAGKVELQQLELDLPALVQQVLAMVDGHARAKGLTLVAQLPDLPQGLRGDPTRLQQALLNLVSNAVKCTRQGAVRVALGVLDDDAGSCSAGSPGTANGPTGVRLRFEVRDTGPGLDESTLQRLFTPYALSDGSPAGHGLGLAITRELARRMGGDAGVDSRPGEGSCFFFTVCLAQQASASMPPRADDAALVSPPSAASPAHAPTQTAAELGAALRQRCLGARVLVVDDDAVNRLVSEALLARAGLVPVGAADGAQALEVAAAEDLALVLLDQTLPDMDGVQVLHGLRQMPRHRHTPVVACTGLAFDEDRQRCLDAGMDDFLGKPVEPAHFYACVMRWLQLARPAVEAADSGCD